MKKKFSLGILAIGLLTLSSIAGCGGKGGESKGSSQPAGSSQQGGNTSNNNTSSSSRPTTSSQAPAEFDFGVSLSNGTRILNKGEEAHINIDENGGGDQTIVRKYTFTSSNDNVASVDGNAMVTALSEGSVRIAVKETNSNVVKYLNLTVIDASPASGGFNYASLAGEEAITKRTEILGSLEKYAMDNHLTGITLFENGGLVKYSERVVLPTTNYITGYGFGLLSEGRLTGPMAAEENPDYKMYLHTASSSDPKNINARNDTGSQVADLEGYITSSFWGTKLNRTKDGYVWYPVLAKDTVKYNDVSQAFDRPIPIYNGQEVKPGEDPNPLGQYKTWRIYVKTGTEGLKYRYNGNPWLDEENKTITLDGRDVAVEDYEFAFFFLLTGAHEMERGAEMAGDQTYGIVGAQKYYNNTKNATINDEQALTMWEDMKQKGQLGIETGEDPTNGKYIQLTILNPIDRFTAMYTFSSNLYSPMPRQFLKAIGKGSVIAGAQAYGLMNDKAEYEEIGHKGKIVDFVLSVGPYMLEKWYDKQAIIFKKNDQWNEEGRYNIAGIKIVVETGAQSSSTAIYDRFNGTKDLDSCGIPVKYVSQETNAPRVYKTKGDSTFKLNINSCDVDMFDKLFGPNGSINKNTAWSPKPWMSNDNFLNGLFYSINRKQFAESLGVQPSINYFSNAYLSDPENGRAYNDTQAHKDAVEAYQTYDANGNSTYGYSRDRAILCFQAAVKELMNADLSKYKKEYQVDYGSKSSPFPISINITWMYKTDLEDYGNKIKSYVEDAFNDDRVCDGKIKLTVTQDYVTNWKDVYDEVMKKGKFDLGFGAISGNTYNPLNFLEVLKSDNSSHFTLNWGSDTSKITPNKPLIYNNKTWSFDALWAVADHGGIVDNGSIAKNVKTSYLTNTNNNFYNGQEFQIITKFIDVPAAKLDVTRVQVQVVNGPSFDAVVETNKVGDTATSSVVISPELAAEINKAIQDAQNIGETIGKEPNQRPNPNYDPTAFVLEQYGKYWTIQVSYNISIMPEGSDQYGSPTENYVESAMDRDSWRDQ